MNIKLKKAVEYYRHQYEIKYGHPYKFFYCPIMLNDTDEEIIKGHIINQAITQASRKFVPQRKNIDNFYGVIEKDFIDFVEWDEIIKTNIFHLEPDLLCNGEKLDYFYSLRPLGNPNWTNIELSGVPIVVIKKPIDNLQNLALELNIRRDYRGPATVSLLKAAHLTCFYLLSYHYLDTAAGIEIATMLKNFYLDNKNKEKKDVLFSAQQMNSKYNGLLIRFSNFLDLKEIDLKGTIEDNKFLVLIGSSGRYYSLGVIIKTNNDLHCVFLPGDSNSIDTWLMFVKEPPSSVRATIVKLNKRDDGSHYFITDNRVVKINYLV